MNIKSALESTRKYHKKDSLKDLRTRWGENPDTDHLLSEYPRPQMVRSSYVNLNGYWDYAITSDDSRPDLFDGQILVPFSPEAVLSGVSRQLKPNEYLWYHRLLPDDATVNAAPASGGRLLLHFGAVDQTAEIIINGHPVLNHEGGYLPFYADITPYLQASDNELLVKVQDVSDTSYHSRGKQTLKRGGMWYTAQSGIWQTVWMEWVPETYIEKVKITPDIDKKEVTLLIYPSGVSTSDTSPEPIKQTLSVSDPHLWSPEDPYLYTLDVTHHEDTVTVYYAMRSFSVEKDAQGVPRFCLNHQPYFMNGVLDQGYWPDGLYTAPSDEALIYDISVMKELGFNMLRKHIKIESARWYYHCDRLGMLVCQDMVNGGSAYRMVWAGYLPTALPIFSSLIKDSHYHLFSRKDAAGRLAWEKECLETVDHLYNVPSIAVWVPFNEGWGQFDAERITGLIKEKDPTRPIDSASGWYDRGCGDFVSIHNYFRPLSLRVRKWKNRAFFLSEYGGYACLIKNHSSLDRIYGYKKIETKEELNTALSELIEKTLFPLKEQGLSGAVLTQLSDVEEEVNGLLTYDRAIRKVNFFLTCK